MFIYFIRGADVFYVQHSDFDLFVLFASLRRTLIYRESQFVKSIRIAGFGLYGELLAKREM